jgi:hypothetical protein
MLALSITPSIHLRPSGLLRDNSRIPFSFVQFPQFVGTACPVTLSNAKSRFLKLF